MSRWGGFRKGEQKIIENWEDMRSSSSSLQNVTSINPINFSYVDAKGIWNLRSTTEFNKKKNSPPTIINSSFASSATSLSVPAHQSGDVILFINGNQLASPPTLSSDFINIGEGSGTVTGSSRSYRLQYKVSDGLLATLPISFYGVVFIIRNFTGVRKFQNFYKSESDTTLEIGSLGSLLSNGTSLVIAGTYIGNVVSSVPSPYTLYSNNGVYVQNNTNPTISNTVMTVSAATINLLWAVEIG